MSLQATLYFPDHPPPASPEVQEDPFCVGLNSYADVSTFTVIPTSFCDHSLPHFEITSGLIPILHSVIFFQVHPSPYSVII